MTHLNRTLIPLPAARAKGAANPAGAPAPPQPRFGTFVGTIDQASTYRLAHWVSASTVEGVPHLHILFQSAGGTVGDGIFLYGLFRSLPCDLTLYNLGAVSSIAALAFLGAKHRKVGKNATFMLHRTTILPTAPLAAKELQARVGMLAIDDQRTERILREHLRMDESRWNDLNGNDVWFTADEAVAVGFADEVADFAPPNGVPLWDFNLAVQGVTP